MSTSLNKLETEHGGVFARSLISNNKIGCFVICGVYLLYHQKKICNKNAVKNPTIEL